MPSLAPIPKLRFSEPKRNLPGRRGAATFEDHFTIAFARAYLEQSKTIHRGSLKSSLVCAREIPVNGYGIADLAVIAWAHDSKESYENLASYVQLAKPCLRAFEMKLVDWRKGLSQAGRYKYFAHQAILVLPEKVLQAGKVNIQTFRTVGTGLWSFDMESGRIRTVYTPRPRVPKCERHFMDAMRKVHLTTRSLPIL